MKDTDLHSWKVPGLSDVDKSALLDEIKNYRPRPKIASRIAMAAVAAVAICASGIFFATRNTIGYDIAKARTLLSEDLGLSSGLFEYRENSLREFF